jgi:hypothetical protein
VDGQLARGVILDGHLWTAAGDLVERDEHTGQPAASVRLPSSAADRTFAAGSVVCARGRETGGTDCVDTRTLRLTRHYDQLLSTAGGGSLWGLGDAGSSLVRVDPQSGRITGRLQFARESSWQPQIAACGKTVWVATGDDHTVRKVDATTMRITATNTRFPNEDSLLVVACTGDQVWVQQNADQAGELFTLRPDTAQIVAKTQLGIPSLATGYGGTRMTIADGSVWTGDSSPTITRVDMKTGRVLRVYRVDLSAVEWVTVSDTSAWVADDSGDGERITL